MTLSGTCQSLVDLCPQATDLANNISQHMIQYLNLSRTQVNGFRQVAAVFLEVCQTLWPIQAGILDVSRGRKQLPGDVAQELQKRITQLVEDFTLLDLLLTRILLYKQKKGLGKIAKTFGILFLELDIHKLWEALSKDRDGLQMGSLAFKWIFGDESSLTDMGRSYTRLALKLKVTEGQATRPTESSKVSLSKASSSSSKLPEFIAYSDWDDMKQEVSPTTTESQYQPQSKQRQSVITRVSKISEATLVDRLRVNSSEVHCHEPPAKQRLSRIPQQSQILNNGEISHLGSDLHTPRNPRFSYSSHTTAASLLDVENMLREIEKSSSSSTASTPQKQKTPSPRSTKVSQIMPEVKSEPMKAALVAAVQQGNHKVIEELLDLGVNPESITSACLLHTALRNRDIATVNLLLLYGMDVSRVETPEKQGGQVPLFAAITADFLEGVETIIHHGAKLDQTCGADQELPQQFAASLGHTQLVEYFLDRGGDVNKMPNGNTLLISAITRNSSPAQLNLLLRRGAQVNLKNAEGKTALVEALTLRRLDLAATLIDAGADVNLAGPLNPLFPAAYKAELLSLLIDHGADLGRAPGLLETAVSINSIEAVRILLNAGFSPNAKNGVYTPLYSAIRDGQMETMIYLLKQGADPNTPACEYPAFACLTNDQFYLLPELVSRGASLHNPKGILETAITHRQYEGVTYLLEQGVDVNAAGADGQTPLTAAIRDGSISLVETLLRNGANPTLRGTDWPLAMAVQQPIILQCLLPYIPSSHKANGIIEKAVAAGQLESVRLLVAAGFSVEDRAGGVFSPLTTALREEKLHIVRYLVDEAGANVNAPGEHLPIIKAIETSRAMENLEIVEMLLTRGADINLVYRGWNAVMQAIEAGDANVLRTLLTWGNEVDLDVCNDSGRSVRELVVDRGWQEGVVLLLGDGL